MLKRRQNETGWTSAKTLSEALPFIQRYSDQTVVIKFGGNAMGSDESGGKAVGLSGKDANLIKARQVRKDLGFAGDPVDTDTSVIETLSRDGFIPVISPISAGEQGGSYNVNADTAAGVLAGALGASRLMLLTDIEGVKDKDGNLLTNLSIKDARALMDDGTATGGMIPKLGTCIAALDAGVKAVVILDGRRAHGLLVELFTDQGAGTLIR